MNEKHLAKIQKCLALSESGNANEAAAALAMAYKLMEKYGLDKDDIEFSKMGNTTSRTPVPKAPCLHTNVLICNIANLFRVKPLSRRVNKKYFIWFIGEKSAASLAAYTFDVLARQLEVARKVFIDSLHGNCKKATKTRLANAFCGGWVYEATRNLKTEPLTESEKNKIESFQNKILGSNNKLSTSKFREEKGGYEWEAHSRGLQEGKGVMVSTPMKGTETAKITS